MSPKNGLTVLSTFSSILIITTLVSVNTASAFGVRPRYEGPMIDAHAHAVQRSVDWILTTLETYHKVGVDKIVFMSGLSALQAFRLRPNEIIPSTDEGYANRTGTIGHLDASLSQGFKWVGEIALRHWGQGWTIAADDPVALQVYEVCAKHQVPITIHHDSRDYRGAYEELDRAVGLSPHTIFVFHGWWLGPGHLSMQDLERLIVRHANLYVELAGELEAAGTNWNEQTFLGGSRQDQFAHTDGRMKEGWHILFERYPERFISGFDLFTQSAYSYEGIKIRVDYFRNLFGQIDRAAAERICYRNVEDLLAKRICLMNVSLSSDRVEVGDVLTVAAQLRSMAANPIRNETVSFFLERSDGKMTSIGEAETDKSGLAMLNYKIDTNGGSYWVVASHPESSSYSYRSARVQLTVNQPTITTTKTAKVTDSTAIPSSIPPPNSTSYIIAGTVATAVALLLLMSRKRKRIELPQVAG